MKLKNVDIFAACNVVLFVLMCIFAYYDRFVVYRGAANIMEFFIYAVFILSAIIAAWSYFRKYEFASLTLLMAEIGIIMHFSGGLIQTNGHRLYDNIFFGIRFDKYVHFTNAFAASFLVKRLFEALRLKLTGLEGITIVLTVLGFGTMIEIIEYIVTLTVPGNGVGGYDNNMQDLIANLAGGIFFLVVFSLRRSGEGRGA